MINIKSTWQSLCPYHFYLIFTKREIDKKLLKALREGAAHVHRDPVRKPKEGNNEGFEKNGI